MTARFYSIGEPPEGLPHGLTACFYNRSSGTAIYRRNFWALAFRALYEELSGNLDLIPIIR